MIDMYNSPHVIIENKKIKGIMEQEFSGQNTNINRTNFNKKRTSLNNLVSGLGKLPPQAVDLEEAVLGALMLEKNALSEVIDILKPDSFYKESHQKIFEAIFSLKFQPFAKR